MRIIAVILALIMVILFSSTAMAGKSVHYITENSPLYYPPGSEDNGTYIVRSGDSLSKIAAKIYGSTSKWKKIWSSNPSIKNPNLIVKGQKLIIPGQPTIVDNREQLTKKAFKIRGIKYVSKRTLLREFMQHQMTLGTYPSSSLSAHWFLLRLRDTEDVLYSLEIYEVMEAIWDVSKNEEWWDFPTLLLTVGIEETRLRNRDGADGEKGYWQWKVSSAKLLRPDMSDEELLYKLEFDTEFSASLTLEGLKQLYDATGSWNSALVRYNGSGEAARAYSRRVIKKFHWIKNMEVD